MNKKLLPLILMAVLPAAAQSVTATIVGTVSDPTGARVAGAPVQAVNTLTGDIHRTASDAGGDYLFPVLPVGQYRVEAEMSGFRRFVREGIQLSVNRNARVDISLEIGQVAEEVRVVGDVTSV